MKSIFFTALFVTIAVNVFGQSPNAFKYQAVLRNESGLPYSSKDVSIRIQIVSDSIDGQVTYSETHAVTTNDYGLVNLEIGNGGVVEGVFSEIQWGNKNYFIRTAMSAAASQQFVELGTSQLMSVPYALHANTASYALNSSSDLNIEDVLLNGGNAGGKSISNLGQITIGESTSGAALEVNSTTQGFLPPRMTDAQRNEIQSPAMGLMIFNTTSGCINYYFSQWLEVCGACFPQPSVASAGVDQTDMQDNTIQLSGNTAVNGTGLWTVVSGESGSFEQASDPTTKFTGIDGTTYVLRWTITTHCGSTQDDVTIAFDEGQVEVGDLYQGGIVVHVDGLGGGIVAALDPLPEPMSWGCDQVNVTGTQYGVGKGKTNTELIVSQCTGASAAKACTDLVFNGYDDWYLPSYSELDRLIQTLGWDRSGYPNGAYWAASPDGIEMAETIQIQSNAGVSHPRETLNFVLPFRTFTGE